MSNPFEDSENGTFLVLVNEEGQHSLWPTFIDVPAGWEVAHPADSHRACQEYIEEHWADMRPKSLTDSLG